MNTKPNMKFDVRKAIITAWAVCWARLEKSKAAGEPFDFKSGMYLTATDLERQVRAFAAEQVRGEAWGSSGETDAWGSRIRISGGGRTGNLLGAVRDWLEEQFHNGTLDRHNFARGHISGARYRVKGTPLAEAEQKSIAARLARQSGTAKPRPRHFTRMVKSGEVTRPSLTILCREALIEKQRAAGRRCYPRWTRNGPSTTRYAQEVTCPRCMKLIVAQLIKTQPRKED